MPFVRISPNFKLFFQDLGDIGGEVVLLLHGLGVNSQSWQMQFEPLIEGKFRVIAPDFRGFGRSSRPNKTNIEVMTEDTAKLLQYLDISQANLVGISMGGTVALLFALEHTHLVNKLVLTNTFPVLKPDKRWGWLFFAWRLILVYTLGLSIQANLVAKRLFPNQDEKELRLYFKNLVLEANPKAYKSAMWSLAKFDIQNRMQEIENPTLIVTSEADNIVPPSNQALLGKNILSARQVFLPDAGHAVIAAQPDVFNTVLMGFLTEN